jgi:hypothetical protein
MLLFLEFLGEVLDLSGPLGAVVLAFLVGLLVWYGMFGGVGIVALVVGGALMGLLMRPQPFITLDRKPVYARGRRHTFERNSRGLAVRAGGDYFESAR